MSLKPPKKGDAERRLDRENVGKKPANSAPGTKVHEIIKKLRVYLAEE